MRALPSVHSAEARGDNMFIQCADSDAVVRRLLVHTDAYDVEVTGRNKEAAFLALTEDGVGLNAVALRLEVRRVLRNRHTLIFVPGMPAAFFLTFDLLPSENVMQVIGPLPALLSLCGGAFVVAAVLVVRRDATRL